MKSAYSRLREPSAVSTIGRDYHPRLVARRAHKRNAIASAITFVVIGIASALLVIGLTACNTVKCYSPWTQLEPRAQLELQCNDGTTITRQVNEKEFTLLMNGGEVGK